MGYRKEPKKSPLNFFSLGIPLTSQNQEIFIVPWCFKNKTLKNFSYENSVFKELFYLFLLFIKFTCLRYKKLHKTAIKSTYLPFLSSIWRWYWIESVDNVFGVPSPHFSLRFWWLKATHSRRGGSGGRGLVFNFIMWLKGPAPRLFKAWIRILSAKLKMQKSLVYDCSI